MTGLPKTRAGTPYLPNEVSLGWFRSYNNATSIDEVYRRIGLLFRRSGSPSSDQTFPVHQLRKSVWTVINEGVQDALAVRNFFDITPELANGKYELPRLDIYDGALCMILATEHYRYNPVHGTCSFPPIPLPLI